MSVGVVIPAYNCEATIQETLESVLAQTVKADEILVMDDGSTDGTGAILESYKSRLRIFRQINRGLANTRNELIKRSAADLIAFLDADDLWHPTYLATQLRLFQEYPDAVACFTAHVNFSSDQFPGWRPVRQSEATHEIMRPKVFFDRCTTAPGKFGPSCVCVPRRVLGRIGREPFQLRIAEDLYFYILMALESGPVIRCSAPVTAYRIRDGSLSSNRVKLNEGEVRAFEATEARYERCGDPELRRMFRRAFAAKRRLFARTLMGAGRTSDARTQLELSRRSCTEALSEAKSLFWLAATHLPAVLQPKWPSGSRSWPSTNQE